MDVHESVGIGSDFLGYRIEELIGRGGMGVVYRAYDLRLKRTVALKLVAPALARDARFRERFAHESELVMSLEHPNVVPIYDAGDVDDRVYLAMRLVDGSDLGALLRAEGVLEPTRAIAICSQIAAALDAAHGRGLVHRDVKPSNVLLDASEHVYLADFGLTRRLDDDAGLAGEDFAGGTPAYLAPEQFESGVVDGRADTYALGCVLYECLTGKPVFFRSSRLAVAWAHLEEEPPQPSQQRDELPNAIDAVIGRALAKDPEQRFATCGDLVAAAQEALGLKKTVRSSRRRPVLIAAAVALGLVVAGIVVVTKLGRAASPLRAGPNTLVRVDATTNTVHALIPVGSDPVAAAAGDYTVWVYSRGSGTITQIDAVKNRVVETMSVSAPAECCSRFTGPLLAADNSGPWAPDSGAWFVEGASAGRKAQLVHIPVGREGKIDYPLPVTPAAVAVGADAVWVVGHDRRSDEVLRIDPRTGSVTAKVRFNLSARVDAIAFGYGHVYLVSTRRGMLYEIDPHSVEVKRTLPLPHSPVTRPEIMWRGHDIWVRTAAGGGTFYSIDPRHLTINWKQSPVGPPDWEEDQGQLAALWWYHQPDGTVNRQEQQNGTEIHIPVARMPPAKGGPCLTSIVAGAGSIWVTAAPSSRGVCKR